MRFKVGKVDANTEFVFVDNGVEFVNASTSIASPTIAYLPTTPETAGGANLFVYPYENVYGGFGIYDGAAQSGVSTGVRGLDSIFRDPGSLFFIGEVGGYWIREKDKLPGRLAIGVWHHNANFERFDGGVENGAEGLYIVFDESFELIIESFYKIQCNSFLSIKPVLQYVVNPGGNSDLDNAFVPGLRVDASF